MRGKASPSECDVPLVGITPAYAGKRGRGLQRFRSGRDHPRACGEKMRFTSPRKCVIGSPPRMRGKVLYVLVSGEPNEDHPRACGEKLLHPEPFCTLWGSPPRMRGKEICILAIVVKIGITPAHAGKSKPERRNVNGIRDHPRACGEKSITGGAPLYTLGSPPRMRGKDPVRFLVFLCAGITPAHAGKRL